MASLYFGNVTFNNMNIILYWKKIITGKLKFLCSRNLITRFYTSLVQVLMLNTVNTYFYKKFYLLMYYVILSNNSLTVIKKKKKNYTDYYNSELHEQFINI